MQKKHKRSIEYNEKKSNVEEQSELHKKIQQYAQKGITLVALVITIVVILILARY